MKYFGPEVKLPLCETGVAPSVERSAGIDDADLVLGSKEDVARFLRYHNTGVVLFAANAELLKEVHKDNVILVGAHALTGHDREFIRAKNIRYFSMQSMTTEGMANICDTIMEHAHQWPNLHIAVSSCVLDSAFSENGYAGGLSTRELLYFLQRLRVLKNYTTASVIGESSPLTTKLLAELAVPKIL